MASHITCRSWRSTRGSMADLRSRPTGGTQITIHSRERPKFARREEPTSCYHPVKELARVAAFHKGAARELSLGIRLVRVLLDFLVSLLPVSLARQRFLGAFLLARFQIEGVPLD